MRPLVLAVLSLVFAAQASAQDFSNVTVEATLVSGTVYMLTGAGGNMGVTVGEDGVILVDDQFKPLSDKIKAAIQGIGGGELRFVLNTHYHGDHTGGNEVFGADATIISQTNVRKRLTTRQEGNGRVTEPLAKDGWPVITFDESVSIHFNGEDIDVRHFPACHTDGDAVVFFRGSNVVHMGDLFFSGLFPFVDHDGGGSVTGLTAAVKFLLAEMPDDVKLIPGHGPLSTKEDLRAYLAMIEGTSAMVAKQVAAGASEEEIVAAGLPGYEKWDWSFISTETWIKTLLAEQTK